MPYRVFFAQIAERLRHTYEGRPNGYQNLRQFRADIRLVANSLQANKGANAGLFYVKRLLRRIDTFGFHLATLDIRQHASVLHEVVARGLDDPDWLRRSRSNRRTLLANALEKDLGPAVELDALGRRNLAVFEAIMQGRHRYGPAAVGYFIVSGAAGADDVLAALLLARWAAAYDKHTGEVALDIAPQFETLAALERCGETMQELLADPLYRRHLEAHGRTQCVLIGYSDGNKEGGLCASRFATHQAQRTLAQILAAADERHVVFHARGGSLARGGGRIDALVKAAPAGAVNGVLRLTEQGESVQQGYGLRPIAMRTLERAFSALALTTSSAQRGTLDPDDPSYVRCAERIAKASGDAYRALVYAESDFYDYFRAVTPIDVIERMQIGSRPIVRSETQGLEALLPVPWVFAWTQTRHMIPGWYGAGTGLQAAIAECGLAQLRDAYANWFFLRNLMDDLETMLARTDLQIAAAYEILAPGSLQRFFPRIRAEYSAACEHVLAIKGSTALLDSEPTLQRSIRLRNPYVDPMNLMQVDLLQRWRAGGRRERDLFDALLASISGIAQGLQSTG
jgi:phosphoenolpyruvate carboxylase